MNGHRHLWVCQACVRPHDELIGPGAILGTRACERCGSKTKPADQQRVRGLVDFELSPYGTAQPIVSLRFELLEARADQTACTSVKRCTPVLRARTVAGVEYVHVEAHHDIGAFPPWSTKHCWLLLYAGVPLECRQIRVYQMRKGVARAIWEYHGTRADWDSKMEQCAAATQLIYPPESGVTE